jgi:hypothetical protein
MIYGNLIYNSVQNVWRKPRLAPDGILMVKTATIMGPIGRADLCLQRLSMFNLKAKKESNLWNSEFHIKDTTMDNLQNCDINILMYHRYKPNSINLLGS